jgi:hypothetical protein
MSLNKKNAADLASAWAKFYHAAMTADASAIKSFADALKAAQSASSVVLWADEMIDMKVAELTKK